MGKRENCQIGVFLSYAGNSGYGLVGYDLYIPQEWFQDSYQDLRDRCRLPAQRNFLAKNQIAQNLLNHAFETGRFQAQWVNVTTPFWTACSSQREYCILRLPTQRNRCFRNSPVYAARIRTGAKAAAVSGSIQYGRFSQSASNV